LPRRRQKYYNPFNTFLNSNEGVLEVEDSSNFYLKSDFLLSKKIDPRYKSSTAARLYKQFENMNRSIFYLFGIKLNQDFDGNELKLHLNTGIKVGSVPLLSPVTNKYDYSLIVKPRFGWKGIGPLMSNTGWTILPEILKLPQLRISEKRIPPWVLSSIVINRIENLLKDLNRRFDFSENDLRSPKGKINWNLYVNERIPKAGFINIPCKYPDLRDDYKIRSAIHYTLIKQMQSLLTQRDSGYFVIQLVDLCNLLIQKVKNTPPEKPTENFFLFYSKNPLVNIHFKSGLEAIDWTVNEKGLSGLGDFNGLPWMMSMEQLFEAFIESICKKLMNEIGGQFKVGRKQETITPINWKPSYLGSQKYLLLDVVIEKEDSVIIFDAKYKDHWEDMNVERWVNLEEEIRERHRGDLLQILAYSTLFNKDKITCCLVYPCRKETYDSLTERRRLIHNAVINNSGRIINLKLTAIPLEIKKQDAVNLFKEICLN
jgi:hypothetical protein